MRESPETTVLAQPENTKSQIIWVAILSVLVVGVVILTSVLTWQVGHQKQRILQGIANKNALLSQQLQQLQMRISTWQNTQQSLSRVLTEAQYWIRVAHLQLTIGQNDSAALQTLLLAQQTLDENQNDVLLPLKQALSENIQALQTATPVHTNEIFLQLNAINHAVSKLSVLPNHVSEITQNTQQSDFLVALRWYDRLWHNIKNLFVVEKLGKPVTILPSQDYWQTVKMNFSMKVAIAEWALLHRNQAIYEESLGNMLADLTAAFPFSQLISPIQDQIQQLQKINLNPTLPSLQNTLAILSRMQLNDVNTVSISTEVSKPLTPVAPPNVSTKQSPGLLEKPTSIQTPVET